MTLRHWYEPQTRPLRLRDGRTLSTLLEAADVLSTQFQGVTHNEALAHAIGLVMLAAETGDVVNREEATDQVARVLAGRGLS